MKETVRTSKSKFDQIKCTYIRIIEANEIKSTYIKNIKPFEITC